MKKTMEKTSLAENCQKIFSPSNLFAGYPATGNNNARVSSTRTSALLRRNQKYVVYHDI